MWGWGPIVGVRSTGGVPPYPWGCPTQGGKPFYLRGNSPTKEVAPIYGVAPRPRGWGSPYLSWG